MRIDVLLMDKKLAPSRSAARRLIEQGAVRWQGAYKSWVTATKAGEDVPDDAAIEIMDHAELRFVSRGGLKLEGALKRCGLPVTGLNCLDLGQSTGGFTDVLLSQGAAKVTGVDVGHGQLVERMAQDPRVRCFEGVNARYLQESAFAAEYAPHSFDLITADLSFISLTLVLPSIHHYVKPGGHILMLVKPQFELQPHQIGKNGVVKETSLYGLVEKRLRTATLALGWQVRDYFKSVVLGGGQGSQKGNTEFFIWCEA
jgi:23S rRNA (cytidine1920-2'-O)/16S rRNA (cytidine1409-2'-O)-methyltransferase